jgi:hypothetical protein
MKRVNSTKGELISFKNPHEYRLEGILFESSNSDTTIIHIHGSYGNFYQAYFVKVMSKIYTDAGFNFLSFNLTCHDGFGEGYIGESGFEYVGGALSEFSTSVSDIQGAIEFAKIFSKKITLQGHSLGCDRVINYLLTSNEIYDFILLAPCDSYKLQSKWISPISVETQLERLKSDEVIYNDYDWLPIKEYGVYSANEEYVLPITRKSLLSLLQGPSFKLFNLTTQIDYFLNMNGFIYIGGKDNLQTEKPETMFNFFKKRIAHIESFFEPDGDHMMKDREVEVAEAIVKWLKNLGK